MADPELERQNQDRFAELRQYVKTVTQLADGFVESQPEQPAYAEYALQALAVWARDQALLGHVNRQGEYEREWTLAGLSLAYLKLREAPNLGLSETSVVEGWLCRIADIVVPYYQRPELSSNRNNHAYWAGLAVASAGVACARRELFEWGLARARLGISQIDGRGILPLELARGRLALHYHRFALSPLVMLAELGNANGVPLYAEGNGAIGRLAQRVSIGFGDPASFAQLAGVEQVQRLPPRGSDLAWAEPYCARFIELRLAHWLADARPLRDERLGGNLTLAFRAPLAAIPVQRP